MTDSVAAESPSLDFEAFFEDEASRIGKAVYLLTGDRSEAEDIVQDAFVRVFEKWNRVRRMESPDGYLYRTAFNLYRKRARRVLRERRARAAPPEHPDPAIGVVAKTEIVRLLDAVSADQREALVLVEWLGLSADEAGAVLGIDPSSVRGRIHRARQTLRQMEQADD